MTRRLRVLLLYGGRSGEHAVSRVSAANVARMLDPVRYELVPVGITEQGRWLAPQWGGVVPDLPAGLPVEGTPITLVTDPTRPALFALGSDGRPDPKARPITVDVVLPIIHGPFGEDGTLQGLLEMAGLAYVGSGVVGSAVGMDKVMMKRALSACGLPTPRNLAFRDEAPASVRAAERLDAVASELGFPCFVKPANLGSSVGISKVAGPDELGPAIDKAFGYDEWLIVEEAIAGREIEVAVLGDHSPEASLPGEIVPGGDFYTYEDKYLDGSARLVAPAELSSEEIVQARKLAIEAYEACRCEGMARVDLFLGQRAAGVERNAGPRDGIQWFVNEVNTIPGFTEISMYPRLWEISGLAYPDLLDRLLRLALDRHARRSSRIGRGRDAAKPANGE